MKSNQYHVLKKKVANYYTVEKYFGALSVTTSLREPDANVRTLTCDVVARHPYSVMIMLSVVASDLHMYYYCVISTLH